MAKGSKGSSSSGGKGKGGRSKSGYNLPSTTGNKCGKGRDNLPPRNPK